MNDPTDDPTPEISPERAAYRERRAADMRVEQRMLDAVADIVKETDWDDPEGIMVDAVVIMLFRDTDGDYGVTWMSAGSDQQAEGMMRRSIRQIETMESVGIYDRIGRGPQG